MTQNKTNFIHSVVLLVFSFVVFYALYARCSEWISIIIVIFIDLYLVGILVECAKRASNEGIKWILPLPSRVCSLVVAAFLLIAIIAAFAHLYIMSESIQSMITSTANTQVILSDPIEGIYFSFVTLTTLGFGDYVPNAMPGQLLVIWQLVSGILLLLCLFPLVVSRISTIDPQK